MGLLGALNTAISGLNVNQQQLDTLSQNVTNANTANYSQEVVNQQADFLAGTPQGASIASITREVNQFLTSQVQVQTSANSTNTTLTSYYSDIQNFLGQPNSSGTIDQQIDSFFTSLQDLANSPNSAAETNVANSATTLAGSISGLATSLQGLRLQADSDIVSSINTINADIKTLFNTNEALVSAAANKQNTAGLLDKRDATLNDLAQYIDIKPTYSGDGEVALSTVSGTTLITPSTYAQLSYTPVGSTQQLINNISLAPINVTTFNVNGDSLGPPVQIASGGPATSVTTTLTGGKVLGLLQMRDSIIPSILSQLDQLASGITTQVNAITNTGASFPPPNSYTGTTLVNGNSTSQWSGNVMIAALTNNGQPIASPYTDEPNGMPPLTLNMSQLNAGSGTAGLSSVDQIIKAINQYYGTPQNKVELGNINNAQLQVTSPNIPDTNSTMSFAFNLNNISASNADFYVGGITVTDSSGNPVASSANGKVTTTQPSVSVTGFTTTAGSDTVTVNTLSNPNIAVGQAVYLNQPLLAANGIPASQLNGFFTVTGVSGNSFTIDVPGAGALASTGTAPDTTTALVKYSTVGSGQTGSTAGNGIITADISSNTISPFYTVQANIATVDSTGKLVTSTVTYRLPGETSNVGGNLIGASAATGGGNLVQPISTKPVLTAELVDASGNPLPTTNGIYGNESGYLKIVANNSSNAVAINQLNSQQLGFTGNAFGTAATNQGFGQYFGLNNLFNANTSAPGVTITNSAVNMLLESRILNNPSLIPTGQLAQGNQSTTAGALPNLTYDINSGDNSITQELASLSTKNNSFPATGGMPSANTSFSQYAGDIIATTSTNSTTATNAQSDSQALLDGFTKSAQAVSGVNLDQQLANTVIYQNAYSASARIITVVDQLFTALISSVTAG